MQSHAAFGQSLPKPAAGGFTPKTLIVDIANNWGHPFYTGGRSIELTKGGGVITNTESLSSFYATSSNGASYLPKYIFDTSLSKTGTDVGTSWFSAFYQSTNQRLLCVFNTPPKADGIIINNFHSSGGGTEAGIKNIKIYSSPNIVTNTAYGSELTGATLLFDGQISQHPSTDTVDDQILSLIGI